MIGIILLLAMFIVGLGCGCASVGLYGRHKNETEEETIKKKKMAIKGLVASLGTIVLSLIVIAQCNSTNIETIKLIGMLIAFGFINFGIVWALLGGALVVCATSEDVSINATIKFMNGIGIFIIGFILCTVIYFSIQ